MGVVLHLVAPLPTDLHTGVVLHQDSMEALAHRATPRTGERPPLQGVKMLEGLHQEGPTGAMGPQDRGGRLGEHQGPHTEGGRPLEGPMLGGMEDSHREGPMDSSLQQVTYHQG